MNIFEALEAGNGKATLEGDIGFYVKQEKSGFVWKHTEIHDYFREVLYIDLKRNDWIPHAPVEKAKKCLNCEHLYFQKIVDLNQQGRCYDCNKAVAFRPNNLYFVK